MTLKEKLLANSARDDSGCVLWRKYLDKKGYGRIRVADRMRTVHRVAWEVAKGPIPGRLCVLHRCDVRRCINPDHLFLGTQADNMADMVAKGRERHPTGSAHSASKLTDQDVRDIRASAGVQQDIADLYGVCQTVISSIKLRKTWRHLA